MLNEKRMAASERGFGLLALRVLIWSALALILSGLVLSSALHLSLIQQKGIALIARKMEKRTGYSVQMSSYRAWPFSPLRLTDLEVQATGKDVLECARALITYRFSMRWPYMEPLEIDLYKPTLYLEKDPVEGWRIPRPEKRAVTVSKEPTSGEHSRCIEFPLPKLRVESGTILGEQNGQRVMALRDVNGALTMKVDCSSGTPRIKMDLHPWQGGIGPGN